MNNTLNVGHLILGAEALIVLHGYGVKPEVALAAINGSSGRSLQTEVRLPVEVLSRKFSYGFKLGLMQKDVRIGNEMITAKYGRNKLLGKVAGVVDEAAQVQGTDVDYTEVCKYLEGLVGFTLT